MSRSRTQPLLAWQRSLYQDNHTTRASLIIHAVTCPMFIAGNLALIAAPFASGWLALSGLVTSAVAMAAQGRAHKMEAVPPVPFDGALDALSRIFAEQWITFPRFVLDGGFAAAWARTRGSAG
ncbi:MAG: terminase [Myxococcales bacterium]|nr:terminase [Myxococcales bacterium]